MFHLQTHHHFPCQESVITHTTSLLVEQKSSPPPHIDKLSTYLTMPCTLSSLLSAHNSGQVVLTRCLLPEIHAAHALTQQRLHDLLAWALGLFESHGKEGEFQPTYPSQDSYHSLKGQIVPPFSWVACVSSAERQAQTAGVERRLGCLESFHRHDSALAHQSLMLFTHVCNVSTQSGPEQGIHSTPQDACHVNV